LIRDFLCRLRDAISEETKKEEEGDGANFHFLLLLKQK
jgi:hypothetical protein